MKEIEPVFRPFYGFFGMQDSEGPHGLGVAAQKTVKAGPETFGPFHGVEAHQHLAVGTAPGPYPRVGVVFGSAGQRLESLRSGCFTGYNRQEPLARGEEGGRILGLLDGFG